MPAKTGTPPGRYEIENAVEKIMGYHMPPRGRTSYKTTFKNAKAELIANLKRQIEVARTIDFPRFNHVGPQVQR
jgi:hypothetical protein